MARNPFYRMAWALALQDHFRENCVKEYELYTIMTIKISAIILCSYMFSALQTEIHIFYSPFYTAAAL